MVTLRRFLSLCALLFWQGGFTFYAAVVVPITRQVLEDRDRLALAALITGPVTNWLNWAGVLTLLLLLWDLAVAVDASRWRYRWRCSAWAVLFVSLFTLFLLHYYLDRLGPLGGLAPSDRSTFWILHSVYLALCTVQWAAGLIYLGASVSAWRAEDNGKGVGSRNLTQGLGSEKR